MLQFITLGWMLVECTGSIVAASRAHSVALLAFGFDSLVELFSATIARFQFTRLFRINRERAARMAGNLLFVLAGVVGLIALSAMAGKARAKRSVLGISITVGALVFMPVLALLKRRKAIETGDGGLAADDPVAALCAIPILMWRDDAPKGESVAAAANLYDVHHFRGKIQPQCHWLVVCQPLAHARRNIVNPSDLDRRGLDEFPGTSAARLESG